MGDSLREGATARWPRVDALTVRRSRVGTGGQLVSAAARRNGANVHVHCTKSRVGHARVVRARRAPMPRRQQPAVRWPQPPGSTTRGRGRRRPWSQGPPPAAGTRSEHSRPVPRCCASRVPRSAGPARPGRRRGARRRYTRTVWVVRIERRGAPQRREECGSQCQQQRQRHHPSRRRGAAAAGAGTIAGERHHPTVHPSALPVGGIWPEDEQRLGHPDHCWRTRPDRIVPLRPAVITLRG